MHGGKLFVLPRIHHEIQAKVITNGEYSAVERADGQLYGTNPVQTEQLQVINLVSCETKMMLL